MINILYSLLVAGSKDIPESFHMYRKHSKVDYIHPGILNSTDPYRKSIYANYIIGLTKLSSLYDEIIKIDKANTYSIDPIKVNPYARTENCIIIRHSGICPVVECSFEPTESGILGMRDGNNLIAEYIDDNTFQVSDMIIRVLDTTKQGSFSIYNPSIGITVPNKSAVSKYISDIPRELLDKVDLDKPWDCAGVLSMSALMRYTKDVVI